jgi:hypothetical protein
MDVTGIVVIFIGVSSSRSEPTSEVSSRIDWTVVAEPPLDGTDQTRLVAINVKVLLPKGTDAAFDRLFFAAFVQEVATFN